ncbi:MAG TPA: DUF4956 domain-containing protein [Bacteroidales bacterium]|nr:DUF4956 domain-containing protein [Bacteroidales bacterium]
MFDNIFDLNNEYFLETMAMFVINMTALFILIRLIYFRYSQKPTFMFAFFLMGIVVFFVGSILNAVELGFGMAVGLVAVLTILRLRTRQITIKDMAYLFAIFGLSVINALRMVAFPLLGRIILNAIILVSAIILENFLLKNKSRACDSHVITYNKPELLRPEKNSELLADIKQLTGMDVYKVKVEKVNYEKQSSEIEIFYWI